MPFHCISCGTRYPRYQEKCMCGEWYKIINIPHPAFIVPKKKSTHLRTARELVNKAKTGKEIKGFEFLGKVCRNRKFSLILHGPPGCGKSTFALKLSMQLSTGNKTILYVSGEEAYSETICTRMKSFGIETDDITVTDRVKLDDVIEDIIEVKAFGVVIDSGTAIRYKPEDFQKIRNLIHGPMIIILHNTKDGQYRGTTDGPHEVDIVCPVDTGIVSVYKNRYHPTMGYYYHVFTGKNVLGEEGVNDGKNENVAAGDAGTEEIRDSATCGKEKDGTVVAIATGGKDKTAAS